ncbi:MAG: major capsid protein [Microvirus sp.]|nr:MAG: major capsid protein [Microvirus sp.]
MKSVMRHQFSQVPKAEIQRSSFDRSHGLKTTLDAGFLVPVFVDEALPGDTFNLRMTTFARFSTPLHPIMDNVFCDVFFFAVPYRLVWTNFPKFFGEQDNPGDSVSYLVPQTVSNTAVGGSWSNGSLFDYMGLPTQVAGIAANSLHLRAYNLIWNTWFRDQNLQNSAPFQKDDGPDLGTQYALLRRGKRHDYFTSALPWPQKGPAVSIPIGTTAAVKSNDLDVTVRTRTSLPTTDRNWSVDNNATYPSLMRATGPTQPSSTEALHFGSQSGLYADLSTATAATINQLRQAFQIQRIYERDARGGTRYTELIQSHFGVTSPDARLQRPEYLGGGSTPINFNPVAQTSATGTTGATTPQGNLSAIGTMSHSGVGFSKSFTEHCVLLGMVSIRADLNYQQGLNRMWSRQTRFDFFWPALAHIGEQSILNQELMAQGTAADTVTWGYQERFAEYRYKPSIVTGQFRSNYAQTLDSWHLSQNFATLPTLGATFIQDNPPIARVVAVPSQPTMLLDCHFSLNCARPMPVYGVPGMIDHF